MIRIEINTGNAAFEENAGAEVARILRYVADRLEDSSDLSAIEFRLRDVNGNTVGSCAGTP